ncbi:MAG: N-acetyltransferase family protein [Bacteroides sp.]|nr:N-acetyltransferase family protein [Bacteroides sp.]
MSLQFKELKETDLPFVWEIYDYYTHHSTIVYFLESPTIENLKSFIPIGDPEYRSFLIETEEGVPIGFSYFNRFKPREAFKISVELTIYLKPETGRKGYGTEIIQKMESIIQSGGFTNIVALIAGENEPSLRFFEKHGYTCCAHIREVAEKFGRKLDLKMVQKIL